MARAVQRSSSNRRAPGARSRRETERPRRRRELRVAEDLWTPDEIKKHVMTVWDSTSPGINCATSGGKTPAPKEDCNCYIKNAARALVSNLPFDDPSFDADAIIAELERMKSGWTALKTDPDKAMKHADKGDVVIAAMTSTDLGEKHGHLAFVIIGKEASGTWKRNFPRCCAGALNAGARVTDRGVHFTFPTKQAMDIRYFARTPDLAMPESFLLVTPEEVEAAAPESIDVVLKGFIQNEPPIDANPAHLVTSFRTKLDAALSTLQAAGTPFKLVEGFRTVERQQFLFGSGRPAAVPYGRPGPILTNADGVMKRSKHQGEGNPGSGRAADCYPMKDGSVIVPIPPSSDPVWAAYANAVKAQGLIAGHEFPTLKDSPHGELA